MADAPPLLTVRALSKSVPGPRLLFEALDLEVRAGEVVAIVGESGVGKSTLLNIWPASTMPTTAPSPSRRSS